MIGNMEFGMQLDSIRAAKANAQKSTPKNWGRASARIVRAVYKAMA
jgi:hypothetical protein